MSCRPGQPSLKFHIPCYVQLEGVDFIEPTRMIFWFLIFLLFPFKVAGIMLTEAGRNPKPPTQY